MAAGENPYWLGKSGSAVVRRAGRKSSAQKPAACKSRRDAATAMTEFHFSYGE
jgi:hypothetical protein